MRVHKTERSCAVSEWSSKPCTGGVEEVLLAADPEGCPGLPQTLWLCQFHHQLELLLWGLKRFLERYPLLPATDSRFAPSNNFQKKWALEAREISATDHGPDPHLNFNTPEVLEMLLNRDPLNGGSGCEYQTRPEYSHLKEVDIDLDHARLTDKQLMAVCLVFYGGVKKNRAARAMKITSQALSDHVKAALKKIKDNIYG
jgi:predicted DNA-binding protein (UPF0251 family)